MSVYVSASACVCVCVCARARLHVSDVSVCPQDKETGFHRGFCWIGFSSEEGLNNALQKDPHVLEGAKVRPMSPKQGLLGNGVAVVSLKQQWSSQKTSVLLRSFGLNQITFMMSSSARLQKFCL